MLASPLAAQSCDNLVDLDRDGLIACLSEMQSRISDLERQMGNVTGGASALAEAETLTGLLDVAYNRVDSAISRANTAVGRANTAAADADSQVEAFGERVNELNDQYASLDLTIAIENLATDPIIQSLVRSAVQPVPETAIIASRTDCDLLGAGWAAYLPATGRMIVGAGSDYADGYENWVSSITGEPSQLTEYAALSQGGDEESTLTVAQMPAHSHSFTSGYENELSSELRYILAYPVSGDLQLALVNEGGISLGYATRTAVEGGSEPHNNMPPYIALHFCEYVGMGGASGG